MFDSIVCCAETRSASLTVVEDVREFYARIFRGSVVSAEKLSIAKAHNSRRGVLLRHARAGIRSVSSACSSPLIMGVDMKRAGREESVIH